MTETTTVNREYRDRLFKFIFGNPENKKWTLSLYNAVNGADYKNADDIVFNTLANAVYMSMKNDVSFRLGDTMNFYEQQSTFNPNMPMRFLIYAGMVYSKYVEDEDDYRRYSSAQQSAPTPRFVCFYNGTTDTEEAIELRLSKTFKAKTGLELIVTMYNINYGHNKELLDSCRPLKEYSWFVDRVRSNQQAGKTLDKALDSALKELPDGSLIKPFLMNNKAEVKRMCIIEYDEARTFAEQKAEGREEGLAEGLEIGRAEGVEIGSLKALTSLVQEGVLSVPDAARRANMTVSDFELKTGLGV